MAQRLSAVYAIGVSRKLFARLGQPAAMDRSAAYIRDFAMARQFLSSRGFVSFFDLPFVPFYLALLLFVHPSICLLTVAGLGAMAAAGYFNFKWTEASREHSRAMDNEAAGFAQSVYSRSTEVRAFGMVPHLLTAWGRKMAEVLVAGEEAATVSSTLYAASRAIRQAIQVITMAWGAWLVLGGNMSGGMIFLASMISGRALAPLEQIIGGWENILRSLEAFNNIEDLTGPDKGLQRRPDLPQPEGHLRARNLVFSGLGGRPVLAGASLDVRPGEVVLLEGAPGAGKSVLMSILAGARSPEAGELLLDGALRDRWPQGQWGQVIGYCGEETGLLSGTIAQNISRFDPAAELDEVYRVTKALGVHELVLKLPQGYQTVISNSFDLLPAGGRKQIALARAFYGRPRVLLLDQPALFLDQKSEGALLNMLADAKREQAAIILVNRSPMLSRIVDRAVTIENGRIVASALPETARPRRTTHPARFAVPAGVTKSGAA
ncbi:ATP-binding cassette domain-containing protein [Roseibium salinum]|uniref:ATP-binding cassette domain-containing protein n=1 Tax=Roseibium salinum TaxID=1604349 RepID=UPI00361F5693